MALRIGKKKQDPAAAGVATNGTAVNSTTAPSTAGTEDWSDEALLGNPGTPTTVNTVTTAPVATDAVADAAPPPKRRVSPLIFVGLALLPLMALGAAAAVWFLFLRPAPVEEAVTPPVTPPPARVAQKDPKDGAIERAANVKVTTNKPAKGAVTNPKGKTKAVPPGKLGIAPRNAKAPALEAPGMQAPVVVPIQAVPTPVQMPYGMAGDPGKLANRSIVIVPPYAPASGTGQGTAPAPPGGAPSGQPGGTAPAQQGGANQQQLKALWEQGAAAKHRGDKAGARTAWQKILKLSPGHPGIQEAINKLEE